MSCVKRQERNPAKRGHPKYFDVHYSVNKALKVPYYTVFQQYMTDYTPGEHEQIHQTKTIKWKSVIWNILNDLLSARQ